MKIDMVPNKDYIAYHASHLRIVPMKLSKSVKPISYLKQNTADAIKEVHENHQSMVITQNGEAKVVIIDIAEYEQDQDTLALLKMLAQSRASYASGDHTTAKKAFTEIRKKSKGPSS